MSIQTKRRLERLEQRQVPYDLLSEPWAIEFRKECMLPLPPGTPQRVIRKGAQRLRIAIQFNQLDDFKQWVREQHAIYGDLLKGANGHF